jgi:hypothetical protein
MSDTLILDVLTSGEVWCGANRVASKSAYPELNAARSLRGVGIPLSTAITFQRPWTGGSPRVPA